MRHATYAHTRHTHRYVHRRHETNASAPHRQDLWQGVLPLQIGGPDAVEGAAEAKRILAEAEAEAEYLVDADAVAGGSPAVT